MFSISVLRPLSISALLLLAAACRQSPAEDQPDQADMRVPVSLEAVSARPFNEPVTTAGLVYSGAETRLSFKIGGIISHIAVKEGQFVAQGQLLATLNPTEIDAQLSMAQQSVDKAGRDLERIRNLQKEQAGTREQLQNAETALAVANENLRVARFNREHAAIRAPHAGRIIGKLGNEGEITGPGVPVLVIDNQGKTPWIVRVGVADRDWARLSVGDSAQVTLDAWPNEVFYGHLVEKAAAADPATGSFELEIQLQPIARPLATGMFAKVQLMPRSQQQVICLPAAALHEGNGKQASVFVTTDRKTARRRTIQLAFIHADCIAVASGLTAGESVITAGAAFLSDGSPIEIMPATRQ